MQHAEENNILYPLQHGFRKGRSCETQLIEFVDDISKNLQEGRQTDILIMDFAKAFDKENHSLLIHKLRYYGIDGKTTRWIHNWLDDRQQTAARWSFVGSSKCLLWCTPGLSTRTRTSFSTSTTSSQD
jgi:hypothetical protein